MNVSMRTSICILMGKFICFNLSKNIIQTQKVQERYFIDFWWHYEKAAMTIIETGHDMLKKHEVCQIHWRKTRAIG